MKEDRSAWELLVKKTSKTPTDTKQLILFFFKLWAAIVPGRLHVGAPAAAGCLVLLEHGCGRGLGRACAVADISKHSCVSKAG